MASLIRKAVGIICLGLFFTINLVTPVAAQGEGLVYVVPLDGTIDSALPKSLNIAFNRAEKDGAELIILEIDTFGGLVDASDEIKNHIYDSPVPVYGYVKKAISGGAYVALACDQIYMRSGATLGAVEPVTGDGQTITDEKTLSVIDGQMRTMAERNDRDPEIASAMVRRTVSIPDVVAADRLLTLTANKALEVGYAEGIVDTFSDIPALAGIDDVRYVHYEESWAVRLARFLSEPTVSALLLSVGMAAMIIEIFVAGFGAAGIISILAFALYFGSNLFVGFAQWEWVLLFFVGVGLLVAEAFVAGFGLLGGLGLAAIGASVVLTAPTLEQGLLTLGLAILLSIIIIAVAFRFLRRSKLWNRLVLSHSESKDRGYIGPKDMTKLLGTTGVTVSHLRPSGMVRLEDGIKVDAITDGDYIPSGTEVVVTGFTSGSVVVSTKN